MAHRAIKTSASLIGRIVTKENLPFLAILLFAFILRFHYFLLTSHQPLWWDEAEYMLKAKSIALGTPETGWSAGLRPILFPFLAAGSFYLGLGEVPLRFLLVVISCAEIAFIYYIGKGMYNRRVGLVASFLSTVFYLDIFYTTRLMVDVPQMAFITLAALLFVNYAFANSSKKIAWVILPIIFFGMQMRFTVALFAFILFLFLFTTERLALFKRKEWYISLALAFAVLLPYLLYATLTFGNPVQTIAHGFSSANSDRGEGVTAFSIFMQYIHYLPSYTNLLWFILSVGGALIALSYCLLSFDKISTNVKTQKYFFLLLWVIIPLVYFGFFVNHFEDRYLFMAFPAIFILSGVFIDTVYVWAQTHYRGIALVAIVLLLGYGAWTSIQRTDQLIQSRVTSYEGLRQAGLWIKDHSSPEEAIISAGMPEITYYSERPTYSYPVNETDLIPMVHEKKARYLIISTWERSPPWTYTWVQEHQDEIVIQNIFYLDAEQKQPSTIIYSLKEALPQ